jgi:hypothetical protein
MLERLARSKNHSLQALGKSEKDFFKHMETADEAKQ